MKSMWRMSSEGVAPNVTIVNDSLEFIGTVVVDGKLITRHIAVGRGVENYYWANDKEMEK